MSLQRVLSKLISESKTTPRDFKFPVPRRTHLMQTPGSVFHEEVFDLQLLYVFVTHCLRTDSSSHGDTEIAYIEQ